MTKQRTILATLITLATLLTPSMVPARAAVPAHGAIAPASLVGDHAARNTPTATPIKHLVVLYDENNSFDHYFGTYPEAANPPGEPSFHAALDTPWASTLLTAHLLKDNPNTNPANGKGATDPFRLDRSEAATANPSHAYTAEQLAYDHGKADLFPKYTGRATVGAKGPFGTKGQVMGYFDGNTVTALWNYAQHFSMSDNMHGDTYGPSALGALEISSGQTNGMQFVAHAASNASPARVGVDYVDNGPGGLTMTDDLMPADDVCSDLTREVIMQGRDIGDLLNAADVTWGGFMGGFDLNRKNPNGSSGCKRSNYSSVVKKTVREYWPHHNWFQYYPSTANRGHLKPASLAAVGYSFDHDGQPDPANHDYSLSEFYAAVGAGNFPAVSYVKLSGYQDGHPGYSDPLDEQAGIVKLVNFIEHQPDWKHTAIIITYDDSGGWYDHGFVAPTNPSFDKKADQLDGPGKCGHGTPLAGVNGLPVNGRCGLGPRLPFLVISPWARVNYISHTEIDQSSIMHFIEDNWLHGERLGEGSFDAKAGSIMDLFNFSASGGHTRPLFLNPGTGEPVSRP